MIGRAAAAVVAAVSMLGIGLACLVPAAGAGQRLSADAAAHTRAAAVAGQQGGSSGGPALASATLEQCLVAADPAARTATFNGQMSTVPGARRMAMQITVQEQGPGEAAFHTLTGAPGGWRRSETGVKIYKYVRQVTDLPAPGTFRAIVQFRWLNEKGHVIKRTTRRTAVCVQPDQRPKLVVTQIQASPKGVAGGTQIANYQIVVRNDGRGAAGSFGVALNVNGVPQPAVNVAALDAGDHTVLDVQAPRCAAGSTVEVVLDPTHQIPEAPGGGQSDTLACPLAEASAARRSRTF